MVSYALGYIGQAALWVGFVCALASAALLMLGRKDESSPRLRLGYALAFVTTGAMVVAAAIIVEGFFAHNIAIQYVAQNYPTDTGSLFWLFQLAGLWASRSGSLLTWGLFISLFAAWVAFHHRSRGAALTNVALSVVMIVLLFFISVMLFSSSNNPFVMTDPSLIEDGQLVWPASAWGMNELLEHWAMALHPPTLFVGYAGMTVPFAYAIASLVCNDPGRRWVELCNRVALFSFVFLTVGIGLGAVWAYVVLGWGGYWGWDPVENASLLSWLTSVAMVHSFTVMRKRSQMRGWCLLCSTLTFCFVILGTFITRSGIVESVHGFSEDPVSTYLFLAIMIVALAALAVLYLVRRKSMASEDDIESVISKNGSYYLTNIVMVFSSILLAYLTISSALPSWLPAGGMSVGAMAYESVARPLGIAFCALAAVCPFLGWKKTDGAQFLKNVRIPAVVGLVVFALLLVHFFTSLYPVYNETIARGGVAAEDLASMGPAWYYNGLAVLALLVASLLAANSAYLIVRGVRGRMSGKGESLPVALGRLFAKSPAQAGGYLTHLGMGVVLVGLVGSSMYVDEVNVILNAEQNAGAINDAYSLVLEGDVESTYDDRKNNVNTVTLDLLRDGERIDVVEPGVTYTFTTNYKQAKYDAVVHAEPLYDLFFVLQGGDYLGNLYINVKTNPLITFVWVGTAIMVLGMVCATWPRRGSDAVSAAKG